MKIYGQPNIKGIEEACPILLNFLVLICARTVKRILPLSYFYCLIYFFINIVSVKNHVLLQYLQHFIKCVIQSFLEVRLEVKSLLFNWYLLILNTSIAWVQLIDRLNKFHHFVNCSWKEFCLIGYSGLNYNRIASYAVEHLSCLLWNVPWYT